MKLKLGKLLLLALGCGLLIYLILNLGPKNIVGGLSHVGWRFSWLLLLMAVWEWLNTWAWKVVLGPPGRHIPMWRIFFARESGEAFNTLLPLATVAGEPLKAMLLKPELPMIDLSASLVVDKTIKFIASLAVIVAGTLFAFVALELPRNLVIGVSLFLCLSAAGLGYFYWLQKRNLLGRLNRLLSIFGIHLSETFIGQLHQVDQALKIFYRTHRRRFYWAIFLQIVSRLVSIWEIYLVALLIGSPVSYLTALFIGSLVAAANAVFAFIPAQLGTFEGSQAFLFHALGLSAADGMALGLTRRIRILTWVGLWLVIFYLSQMGKMLKGEKTKKPSATENQASAKADDLSLDRGQVDQSQGRFSG